MKKTILIILALWAAAASAAQPLWLRYPAISPDGNTVAFNYKGDIWLVDAKGGEARQLTSNAAYDYAPVWAPDSKSLAFASDRYGNFDIFTLPVTGGEPVRVTTHSANETPWAFTPDGREIVFSACLQDPATSVLFPKATMTELYAVPVGGGRPRQILGTPAEEVAFLNSDSFVYQDRKGGENIWRKHHTSSITRDLWLCRDGKHTKLTDFEGEDRMPRLSADGSTVYYLSEREGSFNVFSFPLNDPAKITRVTNHKTHPVRFLSASRDGKLCYGYDGEIYIKNGAAPSQKLAVTITADKSGRDVETITLTGGSDGTVSPDGKQLAFVSRGNVFVTAADYSTTKQITYTPAAESDVAFSPDGRTLAYASERDGLWNIYTAELVRKEDINFPNATLIEEKPLFKNNKVDRIMPQYSPDGKELAYIENRDKLMVMDLATGKTRQVTDGSQQYNTTGYFDYSWSPDGKWFALCYTGNRHDPYTDIGIVKASGGEPVINLTNSGYTDSNPEWVLDGNAIVFTSERYGMRNHASWGTMGDVMIVFMNREAYDRFNMSKEERELQKEIEKLGKEDSSDKKEESKKSDKEAVKEIVVEPRNIEDRIMRLTPVSLRVGSATLDKEGTGLYYLGAYDGSMALWHLDLAKRSAPQKIGGASGYIMWDKKRENLFVLGHSGAMKMKSGGKSLEPISVRTEMVLDHAAEREYMFDRVYRQEKARFYSEKMHGVNWEAMRDAYGKFLPHINNNYDFAELLSEILGELNVSHTGGSYRRVSTQSDASTAELGLFFDLSYEGDGLKVDEVVEMGPFDKASSKVEKGDVIEKIDGVKILRGMDYYPLLNRKAGKRTLVSLRKASGETVEEVTVPITRGKLNDLLYKRWVKHCAEEVDRLSGGRLGYVHLESMGDPSFRTVYSEILGRYNNREGIVIDTRFNGGGRLHEDVEVLFSGEKYLTQVVRGKESCDMPSRRWNKPSIMIMGEANYSNAHGTPWVYKHRNIGKLVGMPVPGTMTSVSWETLQDPTLVFGIPIVGYRTADGSYLENQQLEPDIKVANSKELVVTGRDEQLEAAVKALLEEVDAAKKK